MSEYVIIATVFTDGGSNDIGFARQADGTFRAIISDYDQRTPGARGPYDQAFVGRLTQAYSLRTIQRSRLPGPGPAAVGRDDPGRRRALIRHAQARDHDRRRGESRAHGGKRPGPGLPHAHSEAEDLLGPATHRERTREYYQQARTAAPRHTQSS